MIILMLCILLYLFIKKIVKYDSTDRIVILSFFGIYILFMFLYNGFLLWKGWIYGIPGADMLEYFRAAKYMHEGVSFGDLHNYIAGTRFIVGAGTISYFLYAKFLSILLYYPLVCNIQVSLYLVYTIQIFIAFFSIFNICKYLTKLFPKVKSTWILVILLSFTPFAVQSYTLMRDVYIIFLLSEILVYCANNNKIKLDLSNGIALGCLLLCTILRPYTLIITVPLILYHKISKKLAISSIFAIFAIFTFSPFVLSRFSTLGNVTWQINYPNFLQIIKFIAFPNPINQLKYIFNWNAYFGDSTYISGTNLPGDYLILSLWNIPIGLLIIIGILYKYKNGVSLSVLHLMILVNVTTLYSINYSNIDPRHKMMMIIPYSVLAVNGINKIIDYRISKISAQKA